MSLLADALFIDDVKPTESKLQNKFKKDPLGNESKNAHFSSKLKKHITKHSEELPTRDALDVPQTSSTSQASNDVKTANNVDVVEQYVTDYVDGAMVVLPDDTNNSFESVMLDVGYLNVNPDEVVATPDDVNIIPEALVQMSDTVPNGVASVNNMYAENISQTVVEDSSITGNRIVHSDTAETLVKDGDAVMDIDLLASGNENIVYIALNSAAPMDNAKNTDTINPVLFDQKPASYSLARDYMSLVSPGESVAPLSAEKLQQTIDLGNNKSVGKEFIMTPDLVHNDLSSDILSQIMSDNLLQGSKNTDGLLSQPRRVQTSNSVVSNATTVLFAQDNIHILNNTSSTNNITDSAELALDALLTNIDGNDFDDISNIMIEDINNLSIDDGFVDPKTLLSENIFIPNLVQSDTADVSYIARTEHLEPTSQIMDAIKKVELLDNGYHKITVELSPKELGKIEIHIEMSKNDVRVKFFGENSNVISILKSDTQELERAVSAISKTENVHFSFNLHQESKDDQHAGRKQELDATSAQVNLESSQENANLSYDRYSRSILQNDHVDIYS